MLAAAVDGRKDTYPSDQAICGLAPANARYRCSRATRSSSPPILRSADSAMSSVGSWAWAERTHGRLGRRDRAELLRQGVLARLSALPRPWREDLLKDARSLALPAPPDSRLAHEADDRVRELSGPVLYGHCLRTWALAELFAQRDRVDHDEELLYVACVLHDLGLTVSHSGRDSTVACFAVEGPGQLTRWSSGTGRRRIARVPSPRRSRCT